jgi:large subunit ribosomal protein L24
MQHYRLKKGDMVRVEAGKEKGKTGKIMKIIYKEGKVIIEKVNFVKKHQKPDAKGKGGIVEKEGPLRMSNVMFLCSKCDRGVKVSYRTLDDGKKVRICKKCHEILDA